ncbi:hypothetical protein ACTQ33_06495, partial [Candidatus Avoscillospira sp. LCP25S3_F1]|uniref:hypothetical protein n=1 Tax=Candidatus Avoscillospira sp. LCP25S3_F1 TaxID=3438825 RepID=UPI003F8E158F
RTCANSSLSADIVICLSMVLLYHFWQYRAYFSVRYCLNMKKFLSFILVLAIICTISISAFATESTSIFGEPEQAFASHQLPDDPDIYVDLEDPSALIGELDEDATCTTTISLDSPGAGLVQPNDIHIPNFIEVSLTPGKKGFVVSVTNIGVDALTTLHLDLRLTDYNNKYIDSHAINDVNIPVGVRTYTWLKNKSATIKENITYSGYAIDGPKYDLGPMSTYRYNFAGGAYGSMSSYEGQRHHIPSDAVNGLTTYSGPCIRMLTEDHKKTSSYGSSTSAKEFRAKEEKLVKEGKFAEAMQMGINDIRKLFGTKYDDAIDEMISYAVAKEYIELGSVK